jgi:ABC-type ATPase involved in cell division
LVVTHQHELVEHFNNRVIAINNGYVVNDRMAGVADEN